jgi:hypothetical protein
MRTLPSPRPLRSALARSGAAGLLLGLTTLVAAPPATAGFVNATAASGLFGSQPTWGAQFADVDGDGDLDLFNSHHFYSGFLFTNQGDGFFSVWGLPQIVIFSADRHGWLWVDMDNDAVLDVVCSHGGDGGGGASDDGNELWRGLGDGTFLPLEGAGGMYDEIGRGRAFSGADIDGDGDLDLWHAKAPLAASLNSLYRNDGDMTFTDVAPDWGVADELGTVGVLFADWDDDGDPDALAGGDEFFRPTTLYRNDGGTFTDVTAEVAGELPIAAGADWGDIDGDEDLDLVVVQGHDAIYDAWAVEFPGYWLFAQHRFNDDGVDIFEFDTIDDPIAQFRWRGIIQNSRVFLGPDGVHPTQSSVMLTDEYVGAPTFTPGVDEGIYCWRDSPGGRWIVHVSAPPETFGNYSLRINTVNGVLNPTASSLEQLVIAPQVPRVYRNDGGSFTDITDDLRIAPSANPRHVTFVDFDNDGDLDLHLVNRGTVEIGNEEDILWRNDGSRFVAVPTEDSVPGFTNHFSDGAVWADTDRDGDLDVLVQEGAAPSFFTTGTPGLFYRNDGQHGHWLAVQVDSASGGATAVGTKATAWIGGQAVHRRVAANTWRGFQNPEEMHFGLGTAVVVDSLVVVWPDGTRDSFPSFVADRVLRFSQGSTPVDVPGPAAATAVHVGRVTPQPAAGPQALDLVVPPGAVLRVTVYDVAGRRVRELVPGGPAGAPTRVVWDGRDSAGRPVPAGVYFLRGEGGASFVRRAVRLR